MSESTFNFEPKRLHGAELADYSIRQIDTFFETESRLSEEEKLLEGLQWGIEHNFITEIEADECLRAFKETRGE